MAKNKKIGVHGTDAETGRGADGPKCPITRQQFDKATPIVVSVADRQVIAAPKHFSTGSIGWYAGDKIVVTVDGVPVKVQVGITLTVVGSKELPV